MSGLRYAQVSHKEQKFLDLTSLTVQEFDQLVPAFEEAFQERMKEWCLDGKPRTDRAYRTYANCPLPTPADRLLFILAYVLSRDFVGHMLAPHALFVRLRIVQRNRCWTLQQP